MCNIPNNTSDMEINKLEDVTNVQALISFLDTDNDNKYHDFYHNFTSFYKLRKILESKNWRFTPDFNKNDLHEYYVKESPEKRNKILSASFSWGDEDNMAMWAMYGIPWGDAVRITLTKEAVKSWIEIVIDYTNKIKGVNCVKLHDIVYYQGFNDINENNSLLFDNQINEKIDGKIFSEIQYPKRLSSYIKNSAWKQEQESRISIFFSKNRVEPLYVPFGDSLSFILKNTIITFGPWVSKTMVDAKALILKDILTGIDVDVEIEDELPVNLKTCDVGEKLIIGISPFWGKINLQKHCDYCPWKHATSILQNYKDDYSFWLP